MFKLISGNNSMLKYSNDCLLHIHSYYIYIPVKLSNKQHCNVLNKIEYIHALFKQCEMAFHRQLE